MPPVDDSEPTLDVTVAGASSARPASGGGTLAGNRHSSAPLAVRMRPRSLDELAGQKHLLATGALQGVEGETFEAGRMGTYTIEKDPTRDNGLRIVMGPFTVYDETNVGG